MKYVILGLSITSSWGNGHATTFRGLVKALSARDHDVLFLERDVPWYAQSRDMPKPPFGTTILYETLKELYDRHEAAVREADVVMVGSYVPDGREVSEWVMRTARGVKVFYDIDTPVTLAGLAQGGTAYLSPELLPRFDLYLSFTGGPTLQRIEREFGAKVARPLYCSVDPSVYYPEPEKQSWALGYLGTYSPDRQGPLTELLIRPARKLPFERFMVAGAQYPKGIQWPENVGRVEHIAPDQHRKFYASQRFTLNVTRAEMVKAGYSPSVRLFEAAASGTPIISDDWPGLETILTPSSEILVAHSAEDVRMYLNLDERARRGIAQRARARILAEHTCDHRAAQLEGYVTAVQDGDVPKSGVFEARSQAAAQ